MCVVKYQAEFCWKFVSCSYYYTEREALCELKPIYLLADKFFKINMLLDSLPPFRIITELTVRAWQHWSVTVMYDV